MLKKFRSTYVDLDSTMYSGKMELEIDETRSAIGNDTYEGIGSWEIEGKLLEGKSFYGVYKRKTTGEVLGSFMLVYVEQRNSYEGMYVGVDGGNNIGSGNYIIEVL